MSNRPAADAPASFPQAPSEVSDLQGNLVSDRPDGKPGGAKFREIYSFQDRPRDIIPEADVVSPESPIR